MSEWFQETNVWTLIIKNHPLTANSCTSVWNYCRISHCWPKTLTKVWFSNWISLLFQTLNAPFFKISAKKPKYALNRITTLFTNWTLQHPKKKPFLSHNKIPYNNKNNNLLIWTNLNTRISQITKFLVKLLKQRKW